MYLFLLCISFFFFFFFYYYFLILIKYFLLLFNYSCVPFLVAVYFLSKPLTFLTPLLSLKVKVMVNMRGDPSAPAGVAVRGCVPASVNFAADSFPLFVHFTMGDSQVHLPTPCCAFSGLWPKNGLTLCPTLPVHPVSPRATSSSQTKKSSKGNIVPMWKRWHKKTAELKGIKIDEFRNCFEQWKKVSMGVSHQMESILKVTEV